MLLLLRRISDILEFYYEKLNYMSNNNSEEVQLQNMINHLLLNASFINNLGLFNGKMGVALFFYYMAKRTQNNQYEEFGFSAIEMMMFEIPLIVTDVFGLAEIIIDNESGLKVPVVYKDGKRIVDEKILSDKIEILLTDAKLRKRIGRNARKRFLEKYESHLFTQKMIELYTSI